MIVHIAVEIMLAIIEAPTVQVLSAAQADTKPLVLIPKAWRSALQFILRLGKFTWMLEDFVQRNFASPLSNRNGQERSRVTVLPCTIFQNPQEILWDLKSRQLFAELLGQILHLVHGREVDWRTLVGVSLPELHCSLDASWGYRWALSRVSWPLVSSPKCGCWIDS